MENAPKTFVTSFAKRDSYGKDQKAELLNFRITNVENTSNYKQNIKIFKYMLVKLNSFKTYKIKWMNECINIIWFIKNMTLQPPESPSIRNM